MDLVGHEGFPLPPLAALLAAFLITLVGCGDSPLDLERLELERAVDLVEVPDARASLGLERDSLLALAATLSGDALIQFCGGPMDTGPMGAVPHGVCCPEGEICFELPPIDVIGECDEGKIREPGSDHCVCENDSPEPDCWVDDDPHNPGGGDDCDPGLDTCGGGPGGGGGGGGGNNPPGDGGDHPWCIEPLGGIQIHSYEPPDCGWEDDEGADFLLEIVEVEIDSTYVPVCPPELETRTEYRSQAYAWCKAQAPDSAQVQALNIALNRIEARGGFCKEIAQAGRNLLQAGEIKVFTEDDFPSGVKKTGGVGIQGRGIRLLANWFRYLNKNLGYRGWKVNLEWALTHEIEHYLEGEGHVTPPEAPDYYDETPHARLCSNLF